MSQYDTVVRSIVLREYDGRASYEPMHVHDIISLKDGYANASMRVPSYGTVRYEEKKNRPEAIDGETITFLSSYP